MDGERGADIEQCAGKDAPRVRRDLLFPRVIVEITQLRSQPVVGGIAWGLEGSAPVIIRLDWEVGL